MEKVSANIAKTLYVDGRYRIIRRLGEGSHSLVYQAFDERTKEHFALKLEHYSLDPSILKREIALYDDLRGPGVPVIHWHGEQDSYTVMAMDLLGPNLRDLFEYCGKRFTLKTTLLLADQLLSRLQHIHAKNVIHRDIRPENFMMGRDRRGNTVYIADFGCHGFPSQKSMGAIGNIDFASCNGNIGNGEQNVDPR